MRSPTWHCPVAGCQAGPDGEPWRVAEAPADIEALAEDHARERLGELPEPPALAEMRAMRVEQALADHVAEHTEAEIAAWLA